MGQKNHRRDDAWAHAKQVCRLSVRQVEMAKKLGMNPKKLPGLVPTKTQTWKLPVGAFIEECYARRFEADSRPKQEPVLDNREDPHRVTTDEERRRDNLASDLVCHLANLQDDLEQELVAGRVEPDTLARIARDLRRVADEVDAGGSVSQLPYNEYDLGDHDLVGEDEIPF